MKKLAFFLAFVFPGIFLFAQTAGDYDKILGGDLSAFAGYWVNGRNDRFYLHSDGEIFVPDEAYMKAGGFSKNGDVYHWLVFQAAVELYPVGVDARGFDYATQKRDVVIQTDKTKVRLFAGQEAPGSPADFYYRESVFPATHFAADNIRLRTHQGLDSETIKILQKNTRVLVQNWGNQETIDGLSAKWAYVYTGDGLKGWCYSGYLKEIGRVQ
jgi:hypothetical protein